MTTSLDDAVAKAQRDVFVELDCSFERATEKDRAPLRQFHVQNHLRETVRHPGEREAQTADLEDDFPFLYSACAFARAHAFLVREDNQTIIACIGLEKKTKEKAEGTTCCNNQMREVTPRACSPNTDDVDYNSIIWLQGFSVSPLHRGKGIGKHLLKFVLSLHTILAFDRVRLVTLGRHSDPCYDVMGAARHLYERFGFLCYQEERVDHFGDATSLSVLWYEYVVKNEDNEAAIKL